MASEAPVTHPYYGLRPWKRHSLVLAVGGQVYFLVGLAFLITPWAPARASSLPFLLALAPPNVWAIVWMTSGALAFASTRWPPANETWGYTVMSGLAAWWSAAYALSIILFDAPASSGATGVLVWGLFAFLWWAISGLENPDEVSRAELRGRK